ncbi:hypothetical protein JYT91_00775 [archaeon AH-315-M20]|nr:hypothetical protein [archaeon AH-315-M20]
MQQYPLEHINPSQVKNFFRSLCVVSNRYAHKEQAVSHRHITKLKKHPKIKESEAVIEKELEVKINQLEQELHQTKQERDKAVDENKKQIHELNVALLSIKTRMNEILEHKKEREKIVRELERKIRKKVK